MWRHREKPFRQRVGQYEGGDIVCVCRIERNHTWLENEGMLRKETHARQGLEGQGKEFASNVKATESFWDV